MLALTSNINFIHMLEGILNSGTRHELTVPGGEMRELLLDIKVGGKEMADRVVVVLDEGKIGDGALVTDEPFLLAQDIVQDTKDALDLALEPEDGRGETFGMVEHEPLAIAKSGALMRRLIEQPGIKVRLLLLVGHQKLLLGIVALGNILENGIALPDHLIVVRVVDESGDTTVGVQLAVFIGLLFLFGKVEDDLIVRTAELFHEYDELQPVQTGLGEIEGEWSRHGDDASSMERYDSGVKTKQLTPLAFMSARVQGYVEARRLLNGPWCDSNDSAPRIAEATVCTFPYTMGSKCLVELRSKRQLEVQRLGVIIVWTLSSRHFYTSLARYVNEIGDQC